MVAQKSPDSSSRRLLFHCIFRWSTRGGEVWSSRSKTFGFTTCTLQPRVAIKSACSCRYMLLNKFSGVSLYSMAPLFYDISFHLFTRLQPPHAAFAPSPQASYTSLRPNEPPHQNQRGQRHSNNPIYPKQSRYRGLTTIVGLPLKHVHAENRRNESTWKKHDREHSDGLHGGTVTARFECYRGGVVGLVLSGCVQKLFLC